MLPLVREPMDSGCEEAFYSDLLGTDNDVGRGINEIL